MVSKDLVSVLMPVYNGALFLPDALDSILNQCYNNFEIIVIDDGSTDKTPEILHKFVQMDPRIKVFKHETNLGLTRSLNHGLAECKGKFVARHDTDDLSEPGRFACQVDFLNNHPDYGVIGTAITRIGHQGSMIDQPCIISGNNRIQSYLERVNPFTHGTVMMRKSVLDKVDSNILNEWKQSGMKKIVLKVNSDKELISKFQEVKDAKLPAALITDAGRTQIPPGSKTAFACGPIDEEEAEKYFSELKLL